METRQYLSFLTDLLNHIEQTQAEAFRQAGRWIKESVVQGGVLHAFSTGHSHMLVEDLFYRAGGLIPVNPIFDPGTMLHHGALRSTRMERITGYADAILQDVETHPDEPMIIASNSGINPAPVEMAVAAKKRAMKVIAITSVAISSRLNSRLPSGQKLLDVADLVIDNCIQENDAVLSIKSGQSVGPVSTIAGSFIVQRIVLEAINEFEQAGIEPPVFMSANLPKGDERNLQNIQKYGRRIKAI